MTLPAGIIVSEPLRNSNINKTCRNVVKRPTLVLLSNVREKYWFSFFCGDMESSK